MRHLIGQEPGTLDPGCGKALHSASPSFHRAEGSATGLVLAQCPAVQYKGYIGRWRASEQGKAAGASCRECRRALGSAKAAAPSQFLFLNARALKEALLARRFWESQPR